MARRRQERDPLEAYKASRAYEQFERYGRTASICNDKALVQLSVKRDLLDTDPQIKFLRDEGKLEDFRMVYEHLLPWIKDNDYLWWMYDVFLVPFGAGTLRKMMPIYTNYGKDLKGYARIDHVIAEIQKLPLTDD